MNPIPPEYAGQTLAALVRLARPGASWTQARALIAARHALVNGELCLDPARRLKHGDMWELRDRPQKLPAALSTDLVIRHLDDHIVVAEKPSGINTVRHPAEMEWTQARRDQSPTLEDRLQQVIAARLGQGRKSLPRLHKVHRLDKLTSGLVVFGRSALAERELGRQFHDHTVTRRYLAVVSGHPAAQTIRSWLIRDRGDGRRGSGINDGTGKHAVTHVEPVERLGRFALVSCRLETGRTHQIRVHLAERGHPVCGDPVYCIRRDGTVTPDDSGAPRLALHAAELGFLHPANAQPVHWEMPPPPDLQSWIERLRRGSR